MDRLRRGKKGGEYIMKHLVVSLIVVVAVALGGFTSAYAQNMDNGTGTGGLQNQTPGTGTTNDTTVGGTTTNDTESGPNLWWLLPLLALPVLFFLFKGDNEENRRDYRDTGFAGAKGGRSRRDREEEGEVIE